MSKFERVMKSIFPIFAFLLLLFMACKKNETSAPTVTLLSPLSTDSFYIADSITLHFSIKDKNLVYYKAIFSNYSTRAIYYKEEGNTNTTDFIIHKKIYFSVPSDTMILLNVLGLDKNGNTGNASVVFKLKN